MTGNCNDTESQSGESWMKERSRPSLAESGAETGTRSVGQRKSG